MLMPPTDITDILSEDVIMIFVIIVTVLFSITTLLIMIRDYRLYLEDHWKQRFSFIDFVNRESFYLFLLIAFLLFIAAEIWLRYIF